LVNNNNQNNQVTKNAESFIKQIRSTASSQGVDNEIFKIPTNSTLSNNNNANYVPTEKITTPEKIKVFSEKNLTLIVQSCNDEGQISIVTDTPIYIGTSKFFESAKVIKNTFGYSFQWKTDDEATELLTFLAQEGLISDKTFADLLEHLIS